MTSLKVKYANEIAEAMAKSLGDEEFVSLFHKTASIEKEAGPALEAFKKAVNAVKGDAAKIDALWNQHLPALEKEENTQEGTISAATKARESAKGGPGTTVPSLADDEECMSADCMEGLMASDKLCPECGLANCACEMEMKAAEFTLNHLVKIADALDKRGFQTLANMIDEAMEKVAKKKEKSEEKADEKKKDKKKKKEDKEDKDEKKEEKEDKEDKDEKKDEKEDKDE